MAGTVRVIPLDVEIPVESGETVFEAAWRQGYAWPTRCMGQAQCSLCMVEVAEGAENAAPAEAEEATMVNRIKLFRSTTANLRLACRMKVNGPMTVIKDGVKLND